MAETSQHSPDNMQRLPEKCELTKLQKDIYEFLLKAKPQKALAIAKAMGKTCARNVNPDLYKMQGWNLLECNEGKLWSIKAGCCTKDNKEKTEPLNRTIPATVVQLTDQQKEILSLLKKNKPMRVMDIAKGVGKARAKDVNPDLYNMEKMDLLTHSKGEHLWTVQIPNDAKCKEESEEYKGSRSSSVSSDSNLTDDAPSLNQTETGNQDNQRLATRIGTQCNNDSALTVIASPEHAIIGGQYITQPPIGDAMVQACSSMVVHQVVYKTYNTYIQNSQDVSVGDTLMNGESSQDLGYVTGDYTALADGSGTWDAVEGAENGLDTELAYSTETKDGSLNLSNLSVAEEIQEQPPRTSSPADPDQAQQGLNISTICDGMETVILSKADNRFW